MTEFDKWWDRQPQPCDKETAEKIWHAAQRALLRTINAPPCIPKKGETIRFLGLCHPKSLEEPCEVVDIKEDFLKVYLVETKRVKNGDEFYSSGVLSEVELL